MPNVFLWVRTQGPPRPLLDLVCSAWCGDRWFSFTGQNPWPGTTSTTVGFRLFGVVWWDFIYDLEGNEQSTFTVLWR